MQPLPLGRSTFSALRERNEIYVDKTAMIYELARFDSKIFLARPRRFGKSLLVSTFEELFAHGLKNFQGLAIEGCWQDKTYPVVRLDFAAIKDFKSDKQFHLSLIDLLAANFAAAGFLWNAESAISFGQQFRQWLKSLPNSSLVVLVDEYDAPLTAHIDDQTIFNIIRDELANFYQALKDCESALRFFFMTGITKFSHTSIFSAFNNLTDISLNPRFGALLGWTEEEIAANFSPYINEAASALQTSYQEVLKALKENYDGFCFDQKALVHVYCPWSVLNFFKYPELGYENYWFESGGQPTVLMKHLTNHALAEPMSYGEVRQVTISDLRASRQYGEMSVDVLLCQAGYLTIRSVFPNGRVALGYPNKEVAVSMAKLYADELLRGKILDKLGAPPACDYLAHGSVEDVIGYFNDALNAIGYANYPITSEAACRCYLQVLLIGAAMVPHVETHTALGRSDLEVDAGSRRWVFEFKYAERSRDAAKRLEEALEQIRTRRYGEAPHDRELIRAAAVFNAEERRISAFKAL